MTNEVCCEESSLPVNFSVTVWPMYEARLKLCCVYPVLWFRFEYVASVPSTVPEPLSTCTVSLSYAVEVVVSAVSMCSQNEKFALAHVDGMETDCETVSVCVEP